MTNCKLEWNKVNKGSAIYFYDDEGYETKTVSHTSFLYNRADAEDLDVVINENNIKIIFYGNDNLLNAIYSEQEVNFTNVTYFDGIITNTDSSPVTPSNKEAGQIINVTVITDDDISNVAKVTDKNSDCFGCEGEQLFHQCLP